MAESIVAIQQELAIQLEGAYYQPQSLPLNRSENPIQALKLLHMEGRQLEVLKDGQWLNQQSFEALAISDASISEKVILTLSSMLETCKLQIFGLKNVEIAPDLLKTLCTGICSASIEELHFSEIACGGIMDELVNIILKNQSLKVLRLKDLKLTVQEAALLKEKLKSLLQTSCQVELQDKNTCDYFPALKNSHLSKTLLLSQQAQSLNSTAPLGFKRAEKFFTKVLEEVKEQPKSTDLGFKLIGPEQLKAGDIVFWYNKRDEFSGHVLMCSQASSNVKEIRMAHCMPSTGFVEGHLSAGLYAPHYLVFRLKNLAKVASALALAKTWLSFQPPYDHTRAGQQLDLKRQFFKKDAHYQYCHQEFAKYSHLLSVAKFASRLEGPPFMPVEARMADANVKGAVCNSAILHIFQTAFAKDFVYPLKPDKGWASNKKKQQTTEIILYKSVPVLKLLPGKPAQVLDAIYAAMPPGLRIKAKISHPTAMLTSFLKDPNHFECIGYLNTENHEQKFTKSERQTIQTQVVEKKTAAQLQRQAFVEKLSQSGKIKARL